MPCHHLWKSVFSKNVFTKRFRLVSDSDNNTRTLRYARNGIDSYRAILYSFYSFRSYPLINSRVDINRLKDTSYEVIISVLISDDDITAQSTLDCELRIPDTPYVKRKTFVFFQGKCSICIILFLHPRKRTNRNYSVVYLYTEVL